MKVEANAPRQDGQFVLMTIPTDVSAGSEKAATLAVTIDGSYADEIRRQVLVDLSAARDDNVAVLYATERTPGKLALTKYWGVKKKTPELELPCHAKGLATLLDAWAGTRRARGASSRTSRRTSWTRSASSLDSRGS